MAVRVPRLLLVYTNLLKMGDLAAILKRASGIGMT